MGHYAAEWDDKAAATEITKDWNGIDQVLLRNPHGASAKVSTFLLLILSLSLSLSNENLSINVLWGV